MNIKMKQEFETAYQEQFGTPPKNWNEQLWKYLDTHSQGAWWGWQQSLLYQERLLKSVMTLLRLAGNSIDKVIENDDPKQ